jgi:hypothetical protein
VHISKWNLYQPTDYELRFCAHAAGTEDDTPEGVAMQLMLLNNKIKGSAESFPSMQRFAKCTGQLIFRSLAACG